MHSDPSERLVLLALMLLIGGLGVSIGQDTIVVAEKTMIGTWQSELLVETSFQTERQFLPYRVMPGGFDVLRTFNADGTGTAFWPDRYSYPFLWQILPLTQLRLSHDAPPPFPEAEDSFALSVTDRSGNTTRWVIVPLSDAKQMGQRVDEITTDSPTSSVFGSPYFHVVTEIYTRLEDQRP